MTTSCASDKKFEIPFGQGEPLVGKIMISEKSNKWALLCRGLTGNLSRRSSLDELADTLYQNNWSSLRFDYRKSLCTNGSKNLRTVKSMTKDVSRAFDSLSKHIGRQPDVVVARGFGARLSIEALVPYPDVPLVMWAPIPWLRTSLELRGRLHEIRRQGKVIIDNTEIGPEFVKSLKDPTDEELRSWIVRQRRHVIIQGADDKVSPIPLARDVKDLIEAAGSKVELLIVSGEHPHPRSDVHIQLKKIVDVLSNM